MINKDQSIVMQVAAKIAADLVGRDGDINQRICDWVVAHDAVYEHLSNQHGWTGTPTVEQVIAQVETNFPNTTVVAESPLGGVRVAGKQHGPLPDWLIKQASEAGVSEVWDNRDQLASNPKRPHFKAVQGEKAFWPPKGK
jgi:hypothetical protein